MKKENRLWFRSMFVEKVIVKKRRQQRKKLKKKLKTTIVIHSNNMKHLQLDFLSIYINNI